MKALFLAAFLLGTIDATAQYVGPPSNVGREYGNPKMPLMVSHLAGANREMLKRANRNSRHSIFGRILCFRKLCRIQSGHTAPLQVMSRKQFNRKVARNARKGLYHRTQVDSVYKRKPVPEVKPVRADTVTSPPAPIVKTDSLIILGAELLFEVNKSTLRSDHVSMLSPIVEYLKLHPYRLVTISGHTDDTGSEEHNLALSNRRARVVADYLIKSGIEIRRIETLGLGSANPLVPNTTNEGRRQNRRVELLIHDNR